MASEVATLPERTTDRHGHTGEACRDCGTSFRECTDRIFSPGGRACCGTCRMTDTHKARPPAAEPEPVAMELARVLSGLPAGAPVPEADLVAAQVLQRELSGRGLWLARVPG